MSKFLDVIKPRGGKGLVKKVQDLSSVPVIGHLEGVCHTYIDKDANDKMSLQVTLKAKLRNTSICGATETILIHKEKNKCEIISDKKVQKIYKGQSKLAK